MTVSMAAPLPDDLPTGRHHYRKATAYTGAMFPLLLIIAVYVLISLVASAHSRLLVSSTSGDGTRPEMDPIASETPLLSLGVLFALIWLLGRAYREVVDGNGGSPPSFQLAGVSLWRRWLGLLSSNDLGDPDRFVDKASKLGPAVTIETFWGSQTFVLSPSAVSTAFALPPSQLSPESSVRLHLLRVFGIPQRLLDDSDTLDRLSQIQRQGVSGKSSMEDALRRFAISLERQTAAFKGRKFGRQVPIGQPVNFDGSLRRLVQIASLTSFFGPSFPADEIRTMLVTFTDSIPILARTPRSLQHLALRDAHAARNALVEMLAAWLDSSAPETEAIEMIGDLSHAAAQAGWGTIDVAKLLLAFIVTLIANAPGTLSWTMLHIVQAGPDLLASLREEAANLFWTSTGEDGIDITAATMDAGFAMPNTTDVILETMRLYTCAYVHRVVETDTVVYHTVQSCPPSPSGGRRRTGRRSVNFSECTTPSSRAPSPGLTRSQSSANATGLPLPSALKQPREPESDPEQSRGPRKVPILLKEGTSLVLCGRPAQLSEECWGPDVKVWRPGRWEDANAGNDFWPWGGGAATCDPRHLVLAQLRIALGLVLHYFDVEFVFDPEENFGRPTWAREKIAIASAYTYQATRAWSPGFVKSGAGNGVLGMQPGVKATVTQRSRPDIRRPIATSASGSLRHSFSSKPSFTRSRVSSQDSLPIGASASPKLPSPPETTASDDGPPPYAAAFDEPPTPALSPKTPRGPASVSYFPIQA